MISRIRGTPSVTAENGTNSLSVYRAIRRPIVVLPEPGGPQNTIELIAPFSIESRSGLPSPRRCCWPTTSSSDRGRIRAARGCADGGGVNNEGDRGTSRNFFGTTGNPGGSPDWRGLHGFGGSVAVRVLERA